MLMTRKRLPPESVEHMPEALLLFSDIFLLLEQKFISISFKDSTFLIKLYLTYVCVSLPTLGLGLLC